MSDCRFRGVHENIIIFGDPSETQGRPIGDPLETDMSDRRPIRDLDMFHLRQTCLIGDPSETSTCYIGDLNMLHWTPTCLIGDPSKISSIAMLHRRLTCYIGDWHVCLETHQIPTCPISNWHSPLETDMPVETHRTPACMRSPIGILTHIYLNVCLFFL